jgi:hypothetical protein
MGAPQSGIRRIQQLRYKAILFQVDHAHNHRVLRIKRHLMIMLLFQRGLRSNLPRTAVNIGLALLCCILWISQANALDNLKIVRGILILEGKIEKGDYIKMRNFVADASNFNKMSGVVFLASQGGNILEAIEIGYLIRHLWLSTDAPSRPPPTARSSGNEIIYPVDLTNPRQYQCTSACFLLYIAGIYREFIWTGRLGLHHPEIEYKPIGATPNDLSTATQDIRNKLKNYLQEMNVPNKYLDLMYAAPPNEVHWVTQDEFNADIKGYTPEVHALLDAKCDPHMRPCIARTIAKLRNEAWHKIFRTQ